MMRHMTCEVCKRSVPLTSDLLASAALDLMATMTCPCGAVLEAAYVDNKLVTASVPRLMRFSATGPVMFSSPNAGGHDA